MRYFFGFIALAFIYAFLIVNYVHNNHYRVQLSDKTITVIDTNTDHKPGELVKGDVNIFNCYVESADGKITGTILDRVKVK